MFDHLVNFTTTFSLPNNSRPNDPTAIDMRKLTMMNVFDALRAADDSAVVRYDENGDIAELHMLRAHRTAIHLKVA